MTATTEVRRVIERQHAERIATINRNAAARREQLASAYLAQLRTGSATPNPPAPANPIYTALVNAEFQRLVLESQRPVAERWESAIAQRMTDRKISRYQAISAVMREEKELTATYEVAGKERFRRR
jgi:hypothetical protein